MQTAISSHLCVQRRLTAAWLEQVQAAGIPAIELFCAKQHFDWTLPDAVRELKPWFQDNPLKLHSVHSPIYSDEIWGGSGAGSAINICATDKRARIHYVDEVKRAIELSEHVPFRYLIQHVGTPAEQFEERKIDAAYASLEELRMFAKYRAVEILLENIPNEMSSASRLNELMAITHLDLGFCFDAGHANLMEGVEAAFEQMAPRIRSTHLHDNNGQQDLHYFPFFEPAGTIDWTRTIRLLRTRPNQYPLLLELREVPDKADPLREAKHILDRFCEIPEHDEDQ
jgi:sugar phosphate isomerase/epimerase